ncbi:MAG: hypothetical protein ABW159_03665 [Candidatus Thiodiazotropha sp.]
MTWTDKIPASLNEADYDQLLSSLANWNVRDWTTFFLDLLSDSPPREVHELLTPEVDEHPTDAAVSILLDLDAQSFRVANRALENIINDRSDFPLALRALELSVLLPDGIPSAQLVSLITNADTPLTLQEVCAAILAERDDTISQIFWNEYSITGTPQLDILYIAAIGRNDPRAAFSILSDIDVPEEDHAGLFQVLRGVYASFKKNGAVNDFPELIESLPPEKAELLVEALSLDLLRDESPLSTQALSSKWAFFARLVARNKILPIMNPQYFQQALFEDDAYRPAYLAKLVAAIADEIRQFLKLEKSYPIRPDWESVDSLPELVRRVFVEFNAICAEPQYLSKDRANQAGIIEIGTIEKFALVGVSTLVEQIATHLGYQDQPLLHEITAGFNWQSKSALDRIDEVFAACIDSNTSVIHQPSTVIEEELSTIFDGFRETQKTDSGRTLLRRPTMSDKRQVSSLEDIGTLLFQDNRIAFLDWSAAAQLLRKLKKKDGQRLAVTMVAYMEPLPVGYVYPKHDYIWRDHILSAIENSLSCNEKWDEEFESTMSSALVALNNQCCDHEIGTVAAT